MQIRTPLIALMLLATSTLSGMSASSREIAALTVANVDFNETPVGDALEFLTAKSQELDPDKRGLNIVIDPKVDQTKEVTLRLKNVPLSAVLGYIIELAGLQSTVDAHAVRVFPKNPQHVTPPPKPYNPTVYQTRQLIIPNIEFDEATLSSVIEYLTTKSLELDPEKRGFNFVLGPAVNPQTSISLKLNSIPLSSVLGYVAGLAELKVRADRHAIVFHIPPPKKPAPK